MATGRVSVGTGASRLLLSVLALGLFASAATAQSRQTCPPTQGGSRPSGGDSGGSITVDPGAVIDALKWAAKKKREADAKKKAEAERAAAAERERIAQAERDRAAAERQADAAKMRPIPDPPAPEPEPEPVRPASTRPAADAAHVKPTENAGPRRPRPAPAPETRPSPEPAKPVAAVPPPPSAPPPAVQPPTVQPSATPAPAAEAVPDPMPAPATPVAAPPAVAPAQTELVDVTSGPLSRRLALALAVLLGLLVTALFAARRFMGWGVAPVEVRPGVDPGETSEADFAGLGGPAFTVHVQRGETASEIHYPQPVEGQS